MEFSSDKFKPKKDSFVKHRDGNSKFLYISCASCNEPVMIYQKDGKGGLLRCYTDRMVWPEKLVKKVSDITSSNIKDRGPLKCSACNSVIANPTVYEKEKRPAYRLIPGTIHTYRSIESAENRVP